MSENDIQDVDEVMDPVDESPVEESVVSPGIRDYLAGRGYSVDSFENDDELLEQFENVARRMESIPSDDELEELRRYAELGRRQMSEPPPQPRVEQPVQEEEQKPLWNPPTVNENIYNFVERDDRSGLWKPRQGMEQFIPQGELHKLNEFDQWKRQKAEEFWRNPYEFMGSGLKPQFETLLSPLEQRLQQLEEFYSRQQAETFFASQDGLAEVDSSGRVTGLTEKGRVFQEAYQQANPNWSEQDKLDWATTKAELWALKNSKPAEPVAEPEEKKKSFLERANGNRPKKPANRDASEQWSEKNGTAQNGGMRLADLALKNLRDRGKLVE